MHGLPHILAVLLIVAQVSGCTFLDLLLGVEPPFDPDDPFPIPTAEATFSSGTATIELEGETLVLDALAGEAAVHPEYGVNVRWTDGEGRYLTINAFPDMDVFPGSTYLTLDWIADDRHWVLQDQSRCVVTMDRSDASGMAGSATCRGLEWADYFSFSTLGFPEPIEGEEPFDAEITFEAAPEGP